MPANRETATRVMPDRTAAFLAWWFIAFMLAGLFTLIVASTFLGVVKALVLFGLAAGFPEWCERAYRPKEG